MITENTYNVASF